MWPRLLPNVCVRYVAEDAGTSAPKMSPKYAMRITPTTDTNSASARPERLTPCTDISRPTRGTTSRTYPYLEITAPANAIAAPITQSETSDFRARVTHHIDTASPVSAATS